MIRREVLALAFVLILIIPLASAADVAYIYRKTWKIDDNVVKAFEDLGLEVDMIDETKLPSNFDDYLFIYVGDENYRNEARIKINDYPSIISNRYNTDTWGITDSEGVSQLSSTHPLNIRKDGRTIQVYTTAKKDSSSYLPYYFLDVENKAPSMKSVALVESTSSGKNFGDVISYAEVGDRMGNGQTQQGRMCFFGIVKSDYWTNSAKSLFNECIEHVASQCTVDSDCGPKQVSGAFCKDGDVYKNEVNFSCEGEGIISRCVEAGNDVFISECEFGCSDGVCSGGPHDVGFVEFAESFSKIKIKDSTGREVLIDEPLTCNQDYSISVVVENKGNHIEDVTLNGEVGDINFDFSPIPNMGVGISESRDKIVTFALDEGVYYLNVSANINEDSNLIDNSATRRLSVSCPLVSCFTDIDCGSNGVVGDKFCSESGDVVEGFKTWKCNSAGGGGSFCSSSIENRVIQQCLDACSEGICEGVLCSQNTDCDDSNPLTFDECINPNSAVSKCRNTDVNCASDSDCGFEGFFGDEFCSGDGVSKNYREPTCNNAGTLQSYCSVLSQERMVNECDSACSGGVCISCDENVDCRDFNDLTEDSCFNPGTLESYCVHDIPNIVCTSDSDCGTDEFINSASCNIDGNIVQDYQAYSCTNAGTENSYCVSSINSLVVQECDENCVAGECISPAGECNKNIDCGVDEIISSDYCNGNDVNRLVREWTCNNSGESNSFCSSDITNIIVNSCDFECSEGTCVEGVPECDDGIDNDGDGRIDWPADFECDSRLDNYEN